MKLPPTHRETSPHILSCRSRILSALESGPKFRLELMRELKVSSKTTMNLSLAYLRDRGQIVIVGSAFSTGRKDIDPRAKLYGLPPAVESKPTTGEFVMAARRQPREWRELHRDQFAAMNLAMTAHK